jgi:CRISPR/Cas system CSM-associated protein Csm4 (group 5 of RAMP superfamily)
MKALQLEHQGAQAKRSTGKGEFNTFSSKLASVITSG